MFPIKLRWPLLALFFTGLGYVGQNYTISGTEHLQLTSRSSSKPEDPPNRLAVSAWNWDSTNPMLPSTGRQSVTTSPPASSWQDNLTIGEKMAVWQSGQEPSNATGQNGRSALPGGQASGRLPITSPIPLPGDLASRDPAVFAQPPGEIISKSNDRSNQPAPPSGSMTSLALPPAKTTQGSRRLSTIRIGSFNVQSFGPSKLMKPQVVETLVSIIRQYDVCALQEIQSSRDDILPLIMDRLNQTGRSYDYLVGPRVGRVPPHQQFAFVFDTARVETDRFQLYTVDDPDDLLAYEPLVAWFRCRDAPVNQAFTFSLVNMRLDPDMVAEERGVLPRLLEALWSDGRGEDDIIVAGDMNSETSQLAALEKEAVRFAVQDVPTNVAGTQMLDTIFFSSQATVEFTGRSGVFDFLRKYNLSIERALEVSDHLPIWAEFSVVESGKPGRVAPLDSNRVF